MSETNFDVAAFAYAHRGLWGGDIPENSLRAFEAAAREGVGCELDVRVTADRKLVVFHDATLERMCGRAERVDALSLLDLRKLRLPDGSIIPTLEEALEAMAGLPTLVEMKIDRIPGVPDRNRTGVPALIGVLRFSNAPAGVMSFDEPTVWHFEREIADRPIGMLIEPDEHGAEGAAVGKALRACEGGLATYLAPHYSVLPRIAEQLGHVPRVTWTIRRLPDLAAARAHGAAPIFEGFSPALAKSFANTI